MGFNSFTSGKNINFSDELNENSAEFLTQSGLNLIRQLQDRSISFSNGQLDGFAEAYVDSDGQKNNVNTANTTASFKIDQYQVEEIGYYVIIEATSIDTSAFEINNCKVLEHSSANKFLIYSTSNTPNVEKAEIMQTLFYGTNGSDPRASSTYITSFSNIFVSDTDDVGKQGHYAKFTYNDSSQSRGEYNGSFDSVTESDVWGEVDNSSDAGDDFAFGELKHDGSDVVERDEADGGGVTNNFATGGDTKNNASSVKLYITPDSGDYEVSTFFIADSDVTWSTNNLGSSGSTTTNTDFNTDNSITAFQDGSSEDLTNYEFIVEHNIPAGTFTSTVDTAIGVPFISLYNEPTSNIEYKLLNTSGDDTGWLSAGNTPSISSFTQFSAEPETLKVRLTDTSTTPETAIKGFYVRAD